jgi:hypothetical protein
VWTNGERGGRGLVLVGQPNIIPLIHSSDKCGIRAIITVMLINIYWLADAVVLHKNSDFLPVKQNNPTVMLFHFCAKLSCLDCVGRRTQPYLDSLALRFCPH